MTDELVFLLAFVVPSVYGLMLVMLGDILSARPYGVMLAALWPLWAPLWLLFWLPRALAKATVSMGRHGAPVLREVALLILGRPPSRTVKRETPYY